jgi:DNA-binding NtrC family response regulator
LAEVDVRQLPKSREGPGVVATDRAFFAWVRLGVAMNVTDKILVVDDHIPLAENIAELLEGAGHPAVTAASAEQALQVLEIDAIHALITDFRLPGLNGADLIREMHRRGRLIPAIVMSAYSDDGTVGAARAAGALEVLCKPIPPARLLELVERMQPGSPPG